MMIKGQTLSKASDPFLSIVINKKSNAFEITQKILRLASNKIQKYGRINGNI
jgi:hypothetical protein